MKTKTIKQLGYEITGELTFLAWDNDKITTPMKSVYVFFENETGELPEELLEKIIRANVNDDGFGAKKYLSAKVEVNCFYQDLTSYFDKEYCIEDEEGKPLGNWRENEAIEKENANIALKIK